MPIDFGWSLLLFGALNGIVNYFAAEGLIMNNDTLVKLMSFGATTEGDTSATQDITTNANGKTITTTTATTMDEEVKKDFFALYEMMKFWDTLFWSQRMLKVALPYAYIAMLELAVLMIFSLTMVFY